MTRRFILSVALVAAALWGIFVAVRFRTLRKDLIVDFPVTKMCMTPNVHRPVIKGGAERKVFFVLCRGMAPGRLFALDPVNERFQAVLKSRESNNKALAPQGGTYYGTFLGPSHERTFFLSLATGYSLRPLHRIPLALARAQEGKIRSFLHHIVKTDFDVMLCAEPFIHQLFPDFLGTREYLNDEQTQDAQMADVIKSRLSKKTLRPTLHMYFLGSLAVKSDGQESEKAMSGILTHLMKHVDENGGLVTAISTNFNDYVDEESKHDLLFYGPKVRNQMLKNADAMSLDDVTSTLSMVIGVPQPATCLGMPISNLFMGNTGSRRLTYVRQVEQENYQQLDLLIQKRFVGELRIRRKLTRGVLRAKSKEADFLAERRERLRRKDVPVLLRKRIEKYAEKVVDKNDRRIGWSILMAVPILMFLLIALLFAPTWWHCVLFAAFILGGQILGSALLLELRPSLVWEALIGSSLTTTWVLPTIMTLSFSLWCLLGRFFKWNGPSSLKSFYIVACAVLSLPPLYYYLNYANSAVPEATWWMWIGLSTAENCAFIAPVFLIVGMIMTFLSRRGGSS